MRRRRCHPDVPPGAGLQRPASLRRSPRSSPSARLTVAEAGEAIFRMLQAKGSINQLLGQGVVLFQPLARPGAVRMVVMDSRSVPEACALRQPLPVRIARSGPRLADRPRASALAGGRRSRAPVRGAVWGDAVRLSLCWTSRRALSSSAPTRNDIPHDHGSWRPRKSPALPVGSYRCPSCRGRPRALCATRRYRLFQSAGSTREG
jgi:hypothetical protein